MLQSYLNQILTSPVYDVAKETPLDSAARLSSRLGNQIWLKREDLQPVFSFKIRGAYNRMVSLTPEQRALGVVTASAGNHAQGVALSATHLGVDAIICMPKTTPQIKVDAVRRFGGNVVLHGVSFDEAREHALDLCEEQGKTYIPPYDDPLVIAGQGTIGLELIRQAGTQLDEVYVPVGGGGIIAGVAAFIKAVRPDVKVIGVEHEESACLTEAFKAGERVVLDHVGLFADGVAVKQIGEETWRVAKDTVDAMVTVSTDEICAAIKDIFDDTRSIAEPAGALAVAGMKKRIESEGLQNRNLISIVSGANMNFDRLEFVAERAVIGEQKEALFAVTIPEKPGSFKAFCELLGQRSITEFNYRYATAKKAHIFVGVHLSAGDDEKQTLMNDMQAQGLAVTDLSKDEIAKLHIRHMVGGRAPSLEDELLYRFEFPERPGALLAFLNMMGQRWNISLFHYRNHGDDNGRVLMGIQVASEDKDDFECYLREIGYDYAEETDNPVYQLFLK